MDTALTSHREGSPSDANALVESEHHSPTAVCKSVSLEKDAPVAVGAGAGTEVGLAVLQAAAEAFSKTKKLWDNGRSVMTSRQL